MKERLAKLFWHAVQWLRRASGWDEPSAAASILAASATLLAGCESELPTRRDWTDCKYSSNWDGENASHRMMNILSPDFTDAKVDWYLDWQEGQGCDHCHVLFVNQANGEGAGYDSLAHANHKAIALDRVKEMRRRGLGVVGWIVSDDSDAYREAVFANPRKYAESLADFFPYISYVVLGLEMDEGVGSLADWTALRDAVVAAGWDGPIATHHTAGKRDFVRLGKLVMDQLHTDCTTGEIAASVRELVAQGYAVNGFEYARHPDRARAQAALSAGAFGCGNWSSEE